MIARTVLRSPLGTLLLALPLLAALTGGPARAGDMPVVVELFTSQGCSSCPPADALAGRLAKRENVLALSFHVDYWDYLGWKDTFASPAHTERQRAYARSMRRRTVYTPQMVIDGRHDVVGSHADRVERAIEQAGRDRGAVVPVRFSRHDGMVVLHIDEAQLEGDATVWLVRYDKERMQNIRRGENAGHTITYHNVVRDIRNLGLWRGQQMEIALSTDDLWNNGPDRCAVILQRGGHGPVIGAAELPFSEASYESRDGYQN